MMAERFVEAIFPRFCLRCHREGTLWCRSCQSAHLFRPLLSSCPFCEASGIRTCAECAKETSLDGLVSVAAYADPVMRGAITAWKYDGDRSIEPTIDNWVRQRLHKQELPFLFSTVSFVPLHVGRKRARGFDQAEVLAEMVGRAIGGEVASLLRRTVKTASQAQVAQSDRRLGELDDIFSCATNIHECVLLCDDVFTSGATMDAAAGVLKAAGAKEVWGFTLARGGKTEKKIP